MSGEILYKTERIVFRYHAGNEVLGGVDFSLRTGELVALIGPNGAGKSTLLKLLMGLIKPESGSIEFKGNPLPKISPRDLAKEVAYLPQEDEIHFPFTVGEVVMLGRWPHSGGVFFDSPTDRAAASEAMKKAGISEWSERGVAELSGGERARVMLAKALAGQPVCMLLDEPVSELDLKYRANAFSILRELVNDGVGIIVVVHDIGEVARWADRIVLMTGGKILRDGPPSSVLQEKLLEEAYGTRVKVLTDGVDHAVFAVPSGGAK